MLSDKKRRDIFKKVFEILIAITDIRLKYAKGNADLDFY